MYYSLLELYPLGIEQFFNVVYFFGYLTMLMYVIFLVFNFTTFKTNNYSEYLSNCFNSLNNLIVSEIIHSYL